MYSSPPFFVTLIAGLMMAFAFQLLLTSFGVAIGFTALGLVFKPRSPETAPPATQAESSESNPSSQVAGQIGFAIGFGTLLTINTVLFLACFLAVKMSLVGDAAVGAILGVVIWSAYCLILIWLSSKTVSPLVGAIVGGITSGLRGLLSAVSTAWQGKSATSESTDALPAAPPGPVFSPSASNHTPLVASLLPEGASEQKAEESGSPWTALKGYLENLQVPSLDLGVIQRDLEGLLTDSGLVSFAGKALVGKVDRALLTDLIASRTDFSPQNINQVVDLIESLWQKVLGQTPTPQQSIVEFLETAHPAELTSDELNQRLQQWALPETVPASPKRPPTPGSNAAALEQAPTQILPASFQPLFRAVLQRDDLSEAEATQILRQLQVLQARVSGAIGQSDEFSVPPFNLLQLEVEDYLLQAYPWQLKRKTTKSEFKQILYDPAADPFLLQQQLEPLDRDYFKEVLKRRQDLKPAKIDRIADQLEAVRLSVLAELETVIEQQQAQQQQLKTEADTFWRSLTEFLRDPEQKLTARKIQRQVKVLLKQSPLELSELREYLPSLDRESVVAILQSRQDLTEKRIQQVADQVEKAWNGLSKVPKQAVTAAKQTYDSVTLVVKDAVQQGEVAHHLSQVPRRLVQRSQRVLQDLQTMLEDYLQHTDKADFTPEEITADLQALLRHPQAELEQLGEWLTKFDRSTLMDLLGQRGDLTEAEASRIVEQIEEVSQQVREQAQAMQQQFQERLEALLENIRSYFSVLSLPELDVENLQTDLQKLLNLSGEGFEAVGNYLHEINHETLKALVSVRQDFSQRVVEQIVDRVDSVRLNLAEQAERLRQETENRLQELKQQAQKRTEATRKAAAIAAWWLFGIVFSSALTAAIAGAMAVKGWAILEGFPFVSDLLSCCTNLTLAQ